MHEYDRDDVHTNGIESFWAMLKCGHKGTYNKISPKHLGCYVREIAGQHNQRKLETLAQLSAVAGVIDHMGCETSPYLARTGLASDLAAD